MDGNPSLQRPGISPEFLQAAGVHYLAEPEPQLVIPYFDITGKRTTHWRSRLQRVRSTGQKYDQPAGSKSEVYLPHIPLSKGVLLFITEGEFKSMALVEGGFPAIGLPGLHCYIRDRNNQLQLLPAIREAIEQVRPAELYFVGDSDTVTNLEYYRSASMLSQCFREIQLKLIQLPLSGPKGIDDLRGQLNGQFPDWLTEARAKALIINPDTSFLVPALLQLETVVDMFSQLPAAERERHIHRVIQMAVLAQLAKEEPFTYVARFCDLAWKATKLTKPAFEKAVADGISRLCNNGQASVESEPSSFDETVKPWPEPVDGAKLVSDLENFVRRFVVLEESDYRLIPLTVLESYLVDCFNTLGIIWVRSAEKRCGKSTLLDVMEKLVLRPLLCITASPASLYRLIEKYHPSLIIDEADNFGAENEDIRKIANGGYERGRHVPRVRRYGIEISSSIRDTMVAARLLGLGKEKISEEDVWECEILSGEEDTGIDDIDDEGPLYNPANNALDAVVHPCLGERIPKAIAKLGNSDWSVPEINELQREYVRWDVEHLPGLWKRLESELANAKLSDCFAERMRFFVNLHLIKMTGVPVNTVIRDADREETAKLKTAKREEVRQMFADYQAPVPKSRRKKVKTVKNSDGVPVISAPTVEFEEFNPNVSAQVVAALALHGIEAENAQKETLQKIKAPETELLLEYAEHKARLSAIDGIVRSTFPDGRVRAAGWNQLSARTGRVTSVEPNLQNLPRKWRKAFEAPPGFYWLTVDLSQIEVYVIAIHTGCQRMISVFRAGKDIYVETAAHIFGLEPVRGALDGQVTDLYRDAVKPLVLGINYGLTVYGFIRQVRLTTGLEFTLEEAKGFFDLFFELYPEIKDYRDRALEEALDATETRTLLGQRRFLPPLKYDQDERTGYWPSLEYRKRILLNTPIQSGACILLIGAVNRFLPRLPAGVEPLNLVHDEFNGVAPKELLQPAYDIIAAEFDTVFKQFYGDRLAVKVSGYAGKSWADKNKLHEFLQT